MRQVKSTSWQKPWTQLVGDAQSSMSMHGAP
jgi:hypothetical protein